MLKYNIANLPIYTTLLVNLRRPVRLWLPSWFKEAWPLSPRLQQEVLKVGGSWRSAFFVRFALDYTKIGVYMAYLRLSIVAM